MHTPTPPLSDVVPAQTPEFSMGMIEFVAMMAAVQALQALSIDIMLPALGVIARDLGVSDPNSRQLIVGVYLFCTGIGALFPGATADRFGRRRVVLTGLIAYVVLAIACALASSFEVLLIARGCQGLATAAMMVVPMTIIRDRFSGDRMASMQSLIAVVFMAVPMIAPMIGQALMLGLGWRWIFGMTAIVAVLVMIWVWLRLPETLRPEFRQEFRPAVLIGNIHRTVTTRGAIGYILGSSLMQAAIFAFINCAQQIVAEQLGAGHRFPQIFAAMALMMMLANFVNARIVQAFGARRVSQTAVIAFCVVNGIHLAMALNGETLMEFVVPMLFSFALLAFVATNFQSVALQPFASMAGSAASVMSFLRTSTSALLGAAVGHAYNGTAIPLVAFMTAASMAALVLALYSDHWRPFRRLHYPSQVG